MTGHWQGMDSGGMAVWLARCLAEVRRHAVGRLENASDADLELYLLQLVQAGTTPSMRMHAYEVRQIMGGLFFKLTAHS